jgi:hypothetical protein
VSVGERLAAVLGQHTTTPADCWFAIWTGFGFFGEPDATLDLPGREYVLRRGPIERAAANFAVEPAEQSANLWWPEDRAWFVATDIDLMTTYVGGSATCIADLVAVDGLEAAAVPVDQRVDWRADSVNPLPEDGPR